MCLTGTAPDCAYTPKEYYHAQPTWTAGLSYKLDPRKLLYATISRGYRSGGLNLRGSTPASFGPFVPEIVTNYEAGLKADWTVLGMPLRTNLAAFHQNYSNIQRTVFAQLPGTTSPQAVVLNAA